MSGRKRVDWPPHVRRMLHEELRAGHEAARAAEERLKIRVYVAGEQGVTTRQIADRLGISQASVSKYRRQGEAAFKARRAGAAE